MKEATSPRTYRTRTALITAGISLLAERPLDAISIDEFVAAAGVGKGSFFNHFNDKNGFADAIALKIRADIENTIGTANHGQNDPLVRVAGGMLNVTDFALTHQCETRAMLRSSIGFTSQHHPLNKGVRADIKACEQDQLIGKDAARVGVLFWMGLCSAMIINVLEEKLSRAQSAVKLESILLLGLTGLGADKGAAVKIAREAAHDLRTR